MATYKEQLKNRKYYVLLKGNEVIATFGNLKKVCEYLGDKEFYSYNTVVRKEFPVSYNEYTLYRVKHY